MLCLLSLLRKKYSYIRTFFSSYLAFWHKRHQQFCVTGSNRDTCSAATITWEGLAYKVQHGLAEGVLCGVTSGRGATIRTGSAHKKTKTTCCFLSWQCRLHQTPPSHKLGQLLSYWLLFSSHLDGGREGHSELLCVVGEEVGGCRIDLPGLGGRLGVEVRMFTCQSHKRGVALTCQSKRLHVHSI